MRKLKRAGHWLLAFVIGMLFLVVALLIILVTGPSHAMGSISQPEPQLPPGITCELIREKVAEHGRLASFAWAIRNGYSFDQIRQAKRCLK